MKTFDDITVSREQLAQSYLAMLKAQPGRPLALFAQRRVGKTFFLDHDLTPVAQAMRLLPVYADLWLYKQAPLEAMNHALEEALDDLSVPDTAAGKSAHTTVKSLGGLGFSLGLGDTPSRRGLPTEPALRLDALVARVAKKFGGQILLMLDEVQALGEAKDGTVIVAALRAVLHKHRERICAVFTGSSQEGLALIVNTAGAPMYQFTQSIQFPVLGEEYLRKLSAHYSRVHPGKKLDLDAMMEVFAEIEYRPGLMRDIVKAMSAEGITDPNQGLTHFMRNETQVAVWEALINSVDVLEREVLSVIASGQAPLSKTVIQYLQKVPGANPTVSRIRTAIENLVRKGIVTRATSGRGVSIEDPLFTRYLQNLAERRQL